MKISKSWEGKINLKRNHWFSREILLIMDFCFLFLYFLEVLFIESYKNLPQENFFSIKNFYYSLVGGSFSFFF